MLALSLKPPECAEQTPLPVRLHQGWWLDLLCKKTCWELLFDEIIANDRGVSYFGELE